VRPRRLDALVERADTIADIEDTLAAAWNGAGRTLVVEAAPGLGKTALLTAVREHALAADVTVASARGGEFERAFPFGVARQLLEPLVTHAEPDVVFRGPARLAAQVLDPAEARRATGPSPTGEGDVAVLHGMFWLIANLADLSPLLLVIDDAHWGDAPSLRWLNYLARRLDGLPVALAIANRPLDPAGDGAPIAALSADPATRVIGLRPLTGDGSAVVVRRALGSEADEEFLRACHAVTGGNPFLLHELVQVLDRDGVRPTAASAPTVGALVPETVSRSLVLRLLALPPPVAALARAVAVLGTDAALHHAAALSEIDESEAAESAAALAHIGILAPGVPLEFVHPLVRTAVYEDLPAPQTAVAHARAARVLAAGGAPAERIAAQLLRAAPAGDAWVVAQLRAAASDAMARTDPRTAITCLRRAFVEPARDEQRTAAVVELIAAADAAADPTAGAGLDIDVVAELSSSPEALRAVAYPAAVGLWLSNRADEGLALLDRAHDAALEAGDTGEVIDVVLRRLTLEQSLPSSTIGPREILDRLEPYAAAVEPGTIPAHQLDVALASYRGLTDQPAASDIVALNRRAFGDPGVLEHLLATPMILNAPLLGIAATDDLDLLERLIAGIVAGAEDRGSAQMLTVGLFMSATLAHHRGDLLTAESDAEASAEVYRAIGAPAFSLPPVIAFRVRVLTERDLLDDAAAMLSAGGLDGAIPDYWWSVTALWSRGMLRLAQGRDEKGVDDLLEFGRRCERFGLATAVEFPWAASAVPMLSARGERDLARQLAGTELAEARRWGTPRAVGQGLRTLAAVSAGEEAIGLLRQAVEALAASPSRLEHARALIDLGAALRRANHRSQAREVLRRGLDLTHRCGARRLELRADEELRATGARPRHVLLGGVEALTASERRIARLAAGGKTNREIAEGLFITTKTVETHMGHIFQKLDVTSRKALAARLSGDGTHRAAP
jgi:DNA-binding CsgD family transcriptional regulator